MSAKKGNNRLRLFYNYSAPDDDNREWSHTKSRYTGWERDALPIANAYFGTKIFGICDRERLQLSENSLSTYGSTRNSGTTNFSETYVHFKHNDDVVSDYVRELTLDDATARVSYTCGGVAYTREYFASYPDKVTVIRLSASGEGNLNFTLEPKVPYYNLEGKRGDVTVSGVKDNGGGSYATLTLSGVLPGSNKSLAEAGYDPTSAESTVGYNMTFEAQYRVFASGGTMTVGYNADGGSVDSVDEYSNGTVTVSGARCAYILIALGTNYALSPSIFTEADNSKKLASFPHPHGAVSSIIEEASKRSCDELYQRHVRDYKALFDRVSLTLGESRGDIPTDKLLEEYKAGNPSTQLDELMFAFGRYMLISSSRRGCLPPNLNAIWNRYHQAICLNGYWSNVNTQMNFWAAFSCNLAECFDSYVDFFRAYIKGNSKKAEEILRKYGKADGVEFTEDELWSIETGVTPFVANACYGGRDGYGNTPYMAESFWDYYDYTRDENILREVAYPALIRSANFLTRVMTYHKDVDLYLTDATGSPEQSTTAPYKEYLARHEGYLPRGTTYDQALTYSNYRHVLDSLDILGENGLSEWEKGAAKRIREQVDKLDPIPIGLSGQVKEFREEEYYGEIGEPNHRHMSHLASLYPASLITESESPAWLDAARVSVNGRGVEQMWGWSYVLHVLKRARFGEGNMAYRMLNSFVNKTLAPNMCTLAGGVFQAEGNLGTPAAIGEMLLQSHEGYISVLPALPDAWHTGEFCGLCARGGFEVSASWCEGRAEKISLTSKVGGVCKLKHPGISRALIVEEDGAKVPTTVIDADTVIFDTGRAKRYFISEIPACREACAPGELTVKAECGYHHLSFEGDKSVSYRIYRSIGGAPRYELVADNCTQTALRLPAVGVCGDTVTYAVAAITERGTETRRATFTIVV